MEKNHPLIQANQLLAINLKQNKGELDDLNYCVQDLSKMLTGEIDDNDLAKHRQIVADKAGIFDQKDNEENGNGGDEKLIMTNTCPELKNLKRNKSEFTDPNLSFISLSTEYILLKSKLSFLQHFHNSAINKIKNNYNGQVQDIAKIQQERYSIEDVILKKKDQIKKLILEKRCLDNKIRNYRRLMSKMM